MAQKNSGFRMMLRDLPPLQGASLGGRFPGLKPWAEYYSPLWGIT